MPKGKGYTRLTHNFVRSSTTEGRYGDGRGGLGLSLLVKRAANGRWSKSWSQRIRIGGKLATLGLGVVSGRHPRHGQGPGPRQRTAGGERRGHPEAATSGSNCR